jgi:hypothetical protein
MTYREMVENILKDIQPCSKKRVMLNSYSVVYLVDVTPTVVVPPHTPKVVEMLVKNNIHFTEDARGCVYADINRNIYSIYMSAIYTMDSIGEYETKAKKGKRLLEASRHLERNIEKWFELVMTTLVVTHNNPDAKKIVHQVLEAVAIKENIK